MRSSHSLCDYTEEAEQIIRAEMRRRGLRAPPPTQRRSAQPTFKSKLSSTLAARLCYALAGMCGVFFYLGMKNSEFRKIFQTEGIDGLLVLGFFLFAGLGLIVSYTHRETIQRQRDRSAKELADHVLAGEYSGRFFLYLRPFTHTGKVRQWNPRKSYVPFLPGFFEPGKLELETVFSDALASETPLVALGRPGEQFGSGRLSLNENEWQQVVKRLIEDAYGILVIPSFHAGTKWEIEVIRDKDYFDKCIFVMPREVKFSGINMADEWQQTVQVLDRLKIWLPPYQKSGLFFTLDDNGKFSNGEVFDLTSEEKLRAALARLRNAKKRQFIPLANRQGILIRKT
ncbi:hypothetical protein GWN42_22510 [candidate division KSB1 bacterium]|nr:hypothetical protein [candidate division KSB1 bacterium]NIV95485.1 hypothetical protein [candidate division KSB1 bacterium]